jgi:hypothetical protein
MDRQDAYGKCRCALVAAGCTGICTDLPKATAEAFPLFVLASGGIAWGNSDPIDSGGRK